MNNQTQDPVKKMEALAKKPRYRATMRNLVAKYGAEDHVLNDGDKVTLKADQIMRRKDFVDLQPAYQQFVEENQGRVFTLRRLRKENGDPRKIVELEEDPTWLFVDDDLQLVERGA